MHIIAKRTTVYQWSSMWLTHLNEAETTQSFTAIPTKWLYASLNLLGLDVGAPSWCQD